MTYDRPLREFVLTVGLAVVGFAGITVLAVVTSPGFALGLLLFGGACVSAGILTMYAYVSSLGWEQRGTSAPTVTVTSSQWTEPINTSTYR